MVANEQNTESFEEMIRLQNHIIDLLLCRSGAGEAILLIRHTA